MKYINEKEVRALALDLARRRWRNLPYGRRCSRRFLERMNAKVRVMVEKEVYQHPSKGRTLM